MRNTESDYANLKAVSFSRERVLLRAQNFLELIAELATLKKIFENLEKDAPGYAIPKRENNERKNE